MTYLHTDSTVYNNNMHFTKIYVRCIRKICFPQNLFYNISTYYEIRKVMFVVKHYETRVLSHTDSRIRVSI